MKLTMKNCYAFQKAEGSIEEPYLMSEDEVKGRLLDWHEAIESMDASGSLPSEIACLSSFIKSLADGEVVFEEPLERHSYHAGFEYYDDFEVIAESQEKADEAALKLLEAMKEGMPKRVNDAKGLFTYLEHYVPGYGTDRRIYEY